MLVALFTACTTNLTFHHDGLYLTLYNEIVAVKTGFPGIGLSFKKVVVVIVQLHFTQM